MALTGSQNSRPGSPLVKETVASELRQLIVTGELQPGEPIAESKWAKRMQVAQASIRAALVTLEKEGFVQRPKGRTVYATRITVEDMPHNFQVRTALESLAASLLAEQKPDVKPLEVIVTAMRQAVQERNLQAFYHHDLNFHLTMCRMAGNPVLEQMLRRLLVPLFAFVILRAHDRMDKPARWIGSIAKHRRIIAVLKLGDPRNAAAVVAALVGDFSADIYAITRKNRAS